MQSAPLLDCVGRRRSRATLASFHQGLPPRNKDLRYPADPPTVEEIIAVMHAAGDDPDGLRLRRVIVVPWRAGLRISGALALTETDLVHDRGALLVRRGKGGKRREVGMDHWGWTQLEPWLELRSRLPVGTLFCVLRGPTRPAVRSCGDPRPDAPGRAGGRGSPTVRAAPAAARACRRDVPRRRAAARHPTAARTCRPRHHFRVSPWD